MKATPAAKKTTKPAPALPATFTVGDLEWCVLCEGKEVNASTHEKAVAALGGDWRMPTRQELEYGSPLDLTRYNPAFDAEKYPMLKAGWYRSCTAAAWSPESCAWGVLFDVGLVGYDHRSFTGFALAVRRASQ
jgi:hypothetical protein